MLPWPNMSSFVSCVRFQSLHHTHEWSVEHRELKELLEEQAGPRHKVMPEHAHFGKSSKYFSNPCCGLCAGDFVVRQMHTCPNGVYSLLCSDFNHSLGAYPVQHTVLAQEVGVINKEKNTIPAFNEFISLGGDSYAKHYFHPKVVSKAT